MNPEPSDARVTEHYIDASGARLYTRVTGDGAPLLLLHGWTLDHRSFQPQVEALSRHLKVISIDRRGQGRNWHRANQRNRRRWRR